MLVHKCTLWNKPLRACYSRTCLQLLFSDPVHVLNGLCVLDALLIAVQFLMLVHSQEWQHIVTLVLLMLANYYMLFQMFKNKVILARIYNPNAEDDL